MSKITRVPDWMLERYLLDELPHKERRRLEKELERDPALRAALEQLRQDDRRVLGAYPPDQVIPQILKRAALARPEAKASRRWRLAWVAAPALALAVFLLLILPPILQRRLVHPGDGRPEEYTGLKGDGDRSRVTTRLQLYRRNGDSSEQLRDGSPARAGDLLQVAIIPGGETHGVILSIDGAGAVILHFPEKIEADTALPSGSRVFLPRSYELDEAPGFERFFFISSMEMIPTAAILEKARALAVDPGMAMTGNLDLPGSCRQFSLLIRK